MTRGFRVLFYDPPSRRCALLVFAFALSNGGAAVSLVMFPYYKHARARVSPYATLVLSRVMNRNKLDDESEFAGLITPLHTVLYLYEAFG